MNIVHAKLEHKMNHILFQELKLGSVKLKKSIRSATSGADPGFGQGGPRF